MDKEQAEKFNVHRAELDGIITDICDYTIPCGKCAIRDLCCSFTAIEHEVEIYLERNTNA